jgi:hypothetical protein
MPIRTSVHDWCEKKWDERKLSHLFTQDDEDELADLVEELAAQQERAGGRGANLSEDIKLAIIAEAKERGWL